MQLNIHNFDFGSNEHVYQAVSLLNNVFGSHTMDQALWDWKYKKNPFGLPIGWCASDQSGILAIRLLWPWRLRYDDGAAFVAYQAVDVATHESCRRQGLFTSLNNEALSWIKKKQSLIFNFPNFSRHSYSGYIKLGFQTIASHRWVVVPISTTCVLHMRERQLLYSQSDIADHVSGGQGSVVWSKESLDWRFNQHPRMTYQIFSSENGGSIIYSVIMWRGIKLARIVFSEGVMSNDLLSRFSAHLLKQGVLFMLYNAHNTGLGQLLRSKWGKMQLRDGINFCAYPPLPKEKAMSLSFELAMLDYA